MSISVCFSCVCVFSECVAVMFSLSSSSVQTTFFFAQLFVFMRVALTRWMLSGTPEGVEPEHGRVSRPLI